LKGLFIGIILVSFVVIVGCTQGPCLLGSGNVISETRTVEPFHSVELNGIGTLSVTQDGSPEVKLEAEDNILPVSGIFGPSTSGSQWMRSGG
jgi:hypothetical protein